MDSSQKAGIKHAASFQLDSQDHPSRNRSSLRLTLTLEFGLGEGKGRRGLSAYCLQVI